MFKSIISFIIAHILLLGGSNTQVYVAPTPSEPVNNATTSQVVVVANKATSTPIIKTAVVKTIAKTPEKKVENKTPIQAPKTERPKATTTNKTSLPTFDFETINKNAREAIINILCTTKGNELSPISGTAIVVGQSGLILTNAHIGQYLLLKDYGQKDSVKCVARTGSPAYPRYNLELVYISPTWVSNNKTLLKERDPQGTGENDFAFLRITDNIDGSNLPAGFPFVPMNISENINVNEPVILISYPAGFLGGLSILQNLNVTSAITSIQEVFTFKENTIDLISVPGTVISQKGSSGGAVIDKYSTLIGLISTSSNGDSTSQRDLRAITVAYINRDLQKELGINLRQFVINDPAEFAKKFQEINAPGLTKLITDELNKR